MLSHPVQDNLLIHIGDITVSFALIENIIQSLVGSLIAEHQRIGQIITVEVPFRNLRGLAISLYKERHGGDQDFADLKDLMKRAAKLEEKRNQITHSIWGAGESADKITRIKATAKEKHGLHFHFESIGESDLAGIATELKQLAYDIQKFWLRLVESGKAINNPLKKVW